MSRWLMALLAAVATIAAVAHEVPDAARRRQWVQNHPVLRIAIDPQLGAAVQGGQGASLATEFIDLAARRNGVTLQTVRTLSWEASVEAFDRHRVDMLPSMSDRLLAADVGQRALLSSPFYVGRTVIIARTVGAATLDIWSLRGRTLAFKGGGAYETWLRREHPEIRPLPLADIHQVLAAVETGMADAAVGVDVTYHPIIRRDYALSLRIVGDVPEMPVTLRVAVQRDEPELLAMIEASLDGMTADEQTTVIDRWLETAYLRAPTLSQVVSVYRLEIGLGLALFLALAFALWQLRRAQLASRRGEQQKTLLLGVMSHEVRNAVNAVASSLELMAQMPLAGPQRDLMALAQVGSRNLQDLLRSALDYARSETQGFTPDMSPCDVLGVARDVVAMQQPAIDARGLALRLELPDGPLPWLLLDEVRLRQVLANLLANAVKFTTTGHVGIRLRQGVTDAAAGVRQLVAEVFDTGRGVSVEGQKALFKPFAQHRRQADTRLGGSGLGLVICRDIVQNLGGRLVFTSVEGEGTVVRIELPTSLVPAPVHDLDGSQGPWPAGARVLLVEDHPANRAVMTAQLASLGYVVEAVDNGEAALEVFSPGAFVAVLVDGELPGISGYDVALSIRKQEDAAGGMRTRLLAMSAHDGPEHRARCEATGFDAVLGKPLMRDGLQRALDREAGLGLPEEFRDEARRDLAAIRAALVRNDRSAALRSVHRMHGAALVCAMPDVARDTETLASLLADATDESEAVEHLLVAIGARL